MISNLKNSKAFMATISILVGIILGNWISDNILFSSKVIGNSMYPTYYDNETVFVCRLGTPKRGDVVVVNDNGKYLIKRCIGLPEDSIQIKEGIVYINGIEYKEEYLGSSDLYAGVAEDKISLNYDEYFVLGDNRSVSRDSRQIGSIHKSNIVGVVVD